MIPYNPSSFDRNKTILEQILELKNWLKEHPSYKVYQCFANYMPNQFTSYSFGQLAGDIQTIEAMAVGDVVFFADSYYAVVTAVDLDNQDFDIQSAVSFKGPQGPAGTNGVSVTGATINGSGHLIVTLSDGTTIDAGMSKGADGTNGTNGTDGKYISNATVDGNGDLICTIYDPETSTSTQVNAGYVVGPAGQDGEGIGIINISSTSGTLSASDLSLVVNKAYCIIIFTSGSDKYFFVKQSYTIGLKWLFSLMDSTTDSILKQTYVYVDDSGVYNMAYDEQFIYAQNMCSELATQGKVLTADGNDFASWQNVKGTDIDSDTATNGQVLTADGNGGASWQNAGGGGSGKYMHYITYNLSGGYAGFFTFVNSVSSAYTTYSDLKDAIYYAFDVGKVIMSTGRRASHYIIGVKYSSSKLMMLYDDMSDDDINDYLSSINDKVISL